MDRLNPLSDKFRQVALQNMQSAMGQLKLQKDLDQDPQDALDLQRQAAPEKSESAAPEAPAKAPAPPVEQPASTPPEVDSQALAERVLQGMPEEIRNAARNMVRGQLDKKARPSSSLSKLKAPDGMAGVAEPMGFRNVLDDIVEDGRPLDIDFDSQV
ncbi:MAG: hypothetical protein ACYCW6_00460 [Candidatus Xenobia bacterium]